MGFRDSVRKRKRRRRRDPSGLDLQRAWQDALIDFGVPCVVKRIGLTPDQVADHSLDHLAIQVKPSDSRTKPYVKAYGTRCWEADVLPASVIEQAIESHIRLWLDAKLWKQRHAEIEGARDLL